MSGKSAPPPPTAEAAHERIVRELLRAAQTDPSDGDRPDFDLDLVDLDRRFYEEGGGELYTRTSHLHFGALLDVTWELCCGFRAIPNTRSD